jgi:putative nucleotidyltransferase with HDIG domain
MPDSILVVDDEEPIREIVASMLGTAGYACKQAASGMEALAVLTSGEEFELMLSDLMMADLDGIGLLERTRDKYPNMPVVVVAAIHEIPVALTAIRNGAYDYLLKPFEREQLLNTVSRALENRRLKVENRTYQTSLESLVKARTDQLQAAMASPERLCDMTIETLGEALDLKDHETESHSKRVTAFTIAIARAMGLPREQINVLARGAFLHDIGKVAIPAKILTKPGKFEPDEMTIMKEHAHHGYQIVKKIPFLAETAEIVYSHQEWYNGSGYPRGLNGEQIPLGARIVAVANTLDAITSDRICRPRQTLQAAKIEIDKWAGKQFDPEVVKVFLEMPENIWEDLRQHIVAEARRSVSPTPNSGSGQAQ